MLPLAQLLPWLTASHFILTLPLLLPFFFFLHRNTKPVSSKYVTQSPPPPSPWRLPVIGNLHQLGSFPHHSLRALSHKYGPVMLLHLGRIPTLIISSAKAAQEVMRTQDAVFASRPSSRMTDRMFYDSREVAFAPYGDYWRQARRITVVHMLNNKRVQSFNPVREEEVALAVEKVRRRAASGNDSVNLSELLICLTRDIVCRAAYGRKYSEEGDERRTVKLFEDGGVLLEIGFIGELNPWLGWIDWVRRLETRAMNWAKEIDDFLEKVIKDHRERAERERSENDQMENGDFVDVLLSVNQKDKELTVPLSMNDIKGLILDMYTAGTHTSFVAMDWAMAELIKHPKEMKRVQEEIRAVMASETNKTIKEEHLIKMTYLKAVIKETLRLHPPSPLLLPRESLEDTQLLGYAIPAKTRVLINALAIGRDPECWERVDDFWPQRFLASNVDYKGQDFQFIPFGAGRRGCPGMNFAETTIETSLANFLYHFNWELPHGRKGETLDTSSEVIGFTPHIKPDLVLVAKPWVNV